MVADVVQKGYKGHAYIRGYDFKRAKKLEILRRILRERENKLLDEQIRIEIFISTIKQSDIRQIFELRYMENLNWTRVQLIMGYKHEDTARNKHDKFLKKL